MSYYYNLLDYQYNFHIHISFHHLHILDKLYDDNHKIHERILNEIPKNINKEDLIIEILTYSNCSPIVYIPLTSEIIIETDNFKCEKLRIGFISEVKVEKNNINEDLKKFFQSVEFVAKNNLNVKKLNTNLFYIYNEKPKKDLIIKRNYWEKVYILASVDQDFITLIIEGKYATGINEPRDHEFKLSNGRFYEDFSTFFINLKDQIMEL